MKSTRFLAGVIAGTTLLCAQALISPMPLPPLPAYTAIKQYLNLSDAQLAALQEVQKSRAAANQAIYKQISDKQTSINNLLMSGSSDALQIGQLTLDINNLRKQLPALGRPVPGIRARGAHAGSKEQAARLDQRLQLQPAASQAVGLDLIDGPNIPYPLTFSGTPALIETAHGTAVQP